MKDNLGNIKNLLDEHLSAINENTGEIQIMFDYLQEVEKKVERMNQRLDNLQLTLGQPIEKTSITPLNQDEKKIFLVLYTEENPLGVDEIAEKSYLSAALVQENISNLTNKGVPLQRTLCQGQFFFSLNKEFKDRQAKENLVSLSLQSFM
ncbi:hypothetical protein HYU21_04810 [Candidatus Woesearchaeota archaeon]|nr:hypothetical protein [Candidatus Woesearchaeota archaeon]